MKPALVAAVVAALMLPVTPASATVASPTRSASPSPVPSAPAGPSADAAAIAALRARLGADVADALTKQQQLAEQLTADSARADELTAQVTDAEARIAALQDRIAALDDQIQQTQDRIAVERTEVAALARALARRPSSVLLAFARSRSLADALQTGTDLLVAGHRAHAVQTRLEADLARLDAERQARQTDADRELALETALQAQLGSVSAAVAREQDLAAALAELLDQFRGVIGGLTAAPSEATKQLVALLEQQQRSLIAASASTAWSAAAVGAGSVQVLDALAQVTPSATLLTPIAGAAVTQPFGPTSLWFEPPLGRYAHFHTGVDLAAAEGTPVVAAGDGVVAAVGSAPGGYGNYVVIAHGHGLMTLYAHLRATIVSAGRPLRAGDVIGAEGSTGFSTGPHLHFEVRINDSVVDPAGYIAMPPAA